MRSSTKARNVRPTEYESKERFSQIVQEVSGGHIPQEWIDFVSSSSYPTPEILEAMREDPNEWTSIEDVLPPTDGSIFIGYIPATEHHKAIISTFSDNGLPHSGGNNPYNITRWRRLKLKTPQ
jgi:hypothetical protein